MAKFSALNWKKGVRPTEDFYGRMIPGPPAKLYLTVEYESGKTLTNDIYYDVMKATGRKIMSEKFFSEIKELCKNLDFKVNVNKGRMVIDISELIKKLRMRH